MGGSYRFLATIDEAITVVDWFRALRHPPTENARSDGTLLYFHHLGPLKSQHDSPLVSLQLPRRVRGVLTSIGEVHFLAKPINQFPVPDQIARDFRNWLKDFPCVYSHAADFDHRWDYYLEGSSKNWDGEIYALPEGMAALQQGEYFVVRHDLDFEGNLDAVCRRLELRGVTGILPKKLPPLPDSIWGEPW